MKRTVKILCVNKDFITDYGAIYSLFPESAALLTRDYGTIYQPFTSYINGTTSSPGREVAQNFILCSTTAPRAQSALQG